MNRIDINSLRKFVEEYVASEPARMGIEGFWQTPLLVSASIDERFDILPQIQPGRWWFSLYPLNASL
jgi:hypothetical protein